MTNKRVSTPQIITVLVLVSANLTDPYDIDSIGSDIWAIDKSNMAIV